MRTIAIVQARLSSSRLPGKVLMDIAGRPMIDHVIERALAIQGVDKVVLNVPERDAHAFLKIREQYPHPESYAIMGVPNQEQDVLGSYLTCAVAEKADVIVRLTGDCPLLCPLLAARALNMFNGLANPWAYCANDTMRSGFPDGTDVEVFSTEALRIAADSTNNPSDREHVTPWMRRMCVNYSVMAPGGWGMDLLGVKWSVDTQEDLDCVRAIFAFLQPGELCATGTAYAYRVMKGLFGGTV